jgi:hypothetical protein
MTGTFPVIADVEFAKSFKTFACLEVEDDRKFSIHTNGKATRKVPNSRAAALSCPQKFLIHHAVRIQNPVVGISKGLPHMHLALALQIA